MVQVAYVLPPIFFGVKYDLIQLHKQFIHQSDGISMRNSLKPSPPNLKKTMKMTWLHMEWICFDFYYWPKPSQIGQNGLAAAADARLAGYSIMSQKVCIWVCLFLGCGWFCFFKTIFLERTFLKKLLLTNKWKEPAFHLLGINLKCTWGKLFLCQWMDMNVKLFLTPLQLLCPILLSFNVPPKNSWGLLLRPYAKAVHYVKTTLHFCTHLIMES